jgi:hypothetical protein
VLAWFDQSRLCDEVILCEPNREVLFGVLSAVPHKWSDSLATARNCSRYESDSPLVRE